MVVPELATLVCRMQPLTQLFRGLASWVKRQLWAHSMQQVRRQTLQFEEAARPGRWWFLVSCRRQTSNMRHQWPLPKHPQQYLPTEPMAFQGRPAPKDWVVTLVLCQG